MIWFNVSPRITKHLLKLDHIYMLYTSTMKYYVDPRKIITYGDMVTCIVREIRSEMRNTKVRQLWMLNIWVMRPTATQNFIFICWFQICWNFWGSTITSVDNSAFKCYFLTFFISNLLSNTLIPKRRSHYNRCYWQLAGQSYLYNSSFNYCCCSLWVLTYNN